MRDQEFEQLDIIRCTSALARIVWIDKERHAVYAMLHDAVGKRRHARILSFLNARLVRIGLADDIDRRKGYPHSKLHSARFDKALVAAILKERIAKDARIPVLAHKLAFQKLFRVFPHFCRNGLPVASTMLQNAILLLILNELFRQRFEKRRVMIVQQVPQFAFERNRRNFSPAIRPLTRVAFSVRVSVGIGIDRFDH